MGVFFLLLKKMFLQEYEHNLSFIKCMFEIQEEKNHIYAKYYPYDNLKTLNQLMDWKIDIVMFDTAISTYNYVFGFHSKHLKKLMDKYKLCCLKNQGEYDITDMDKIYSFVKVKNFCNYIDTVGQNLPWSECSDF